MTPGKIKLIKVVIVMLFSSGTYIIYLVNSSSSEEGVSQKINEEASKAAFSDRLRANDLKPVELGQAKMTDAETQKLENKEISNNSTKETNQPKKVASDKNNEIDHSKSNATSPWDAALSGTQLLLTETVFDPNSQEMQNQGNIDPTKAKDAQKFVQIVSTPSMVHDATVRKVDAPSKIESSQTFNSNPTNNSSTNQNYSNIEIKKTKFARLASMGNEKLSIISGKEQVAGRGQMFKAGTRVYALLPDKLTVTSGEKLDTSLIAFGSTEQKFPNNVTFVGQAQLNKSNRRVEIAIDKCVNTRDDSPPLPCKAIVKDIMGDNGLSGKIYDPANWQLLIATAGTFLSTYVLGTLTTTVAQTGVTVDPTVANQVRQALASSVNSIATRLSDSINKSGTEITISPGAIVQVFFVDTSSTWNLSTN